jgi:hypothetical protein
VVHLVEHLLVEIDQVHLVLREHQVRDPQQRQDHSVSSGLLGQPLGASTSTRPEVGGGGLVTMLRVYCMCPGESATMILRFGSRSAGRSYAMLPRRTQPVGQQRGAARLDGGIDVVGHDALVPPDLLRLADLPRVRPAAPTRPYRDQAV